MKGSSSILRKRKIRAKFLEELEIFVDTIEARHGDLISWESKDAHISIFVPEARLLFETEERIFDSDGKNIELEVKYKPERSEKRKFYYAAYHHDKKDFAVGHSSPKIIIMG